MLTLDRLDMFSQELSAAYLAAGRRIEDADLSRLATDLSRGVPCPDAMVHDVFMQARKSADLPTYRVLCEAYHLLIANAPVVAALPKPDGYVDPALRPVWRREALKNYCIACGCYDEFVSAMLTRKVAKGHVEYVDPRRASEFESSMVPMFSPEIYDYDRGGTPVPTADVFRRAMKGAI